MLQAIQDLQSLIESALLAHLPQCRHPGAKPLDDALRYAVSSGGKRLRPILTIMGARIFDADPRRVLGAACAVEFIHTSSLIFDDLPCMDDAEIRRGVPVLHNVYGEEVALLAGIALLNQSYAIFGQVPALIHEATQCIGVEGMIGGQALDLTPYDGDDEALLKRSKNLAERNRKTSAMMRLALIAGALALGVPPEEAEPLGIAGQCLGQAYQIGDDLLDARRSSHATGKTTGQDRRHGRPSHGLIDGNVCLEQVNVLVRQAGQSLQSAYGTRSAELVAAVDAIFQAQLNAVSSVS